MISNVLALLFSACSLATLLIVNLGVTIQSSFLPEIYLAKISQAQTGKSIHYGIYTSCIYDNSSIRISCIPKMPGYSFDVNQFAEVCGLDTSTLAVSKAINNLQNAPELATFKGIVLIMPAVILSFVAFACTLFVRRYRSSNAIPFISIFASLFSFLSGAVGLALIIITFWKGLSAIEKNIPGLSRQWGVAIYLISAGLGCTLMAFVCFIITLCSYRNDRENRRTIYMYDFDGKSVQNHAVTTDRALYDVSPTAYLNQPIQHNNLESSVPNSPAYPTHSTTSQNYQNKKTYNLQDVYNAYEQHNTFAQPNAYTNVEAYNHYGDFSHSDACHMPTAQMQTNEAYRQHGTYYHQNDYSQQQKSTYF
ncbi:hypothetical protein EDC96DRAFT_520729 [Choanephora cucurbitarum]|nr:hypothetical protein EDC96DRAFT_520729 [Choanephora cucurbitarum]